MNIVHAGSVTRYETAVFAGGCFWQFEPYFEDLKGVLSVSAGYTGGQTQNPTYAEVSSGSTGHLESVEVRYNPNQITYDELLQVFWQSIDLQMQTDNLTTLAHSTTPLCFTTARGKRLPLKLPETRWLQPESLTSRL